MYDRTERLCKPFMAVLLLTFGHAQQKNSSELDFSAARLTAPPTMNWPTNGEACVVCHGDDGKGGHGSGAPLTGTRDFAATVRTVTEGRNNMPPFSGTLTPEQIRDVVGYLVEVLAKAAQYTCFPPHSPP
jgi:mono/diheme cytochrome c family protein